MTTDRIHSGPGTVGLEIAGGVRTSRPSSPDRRRRLATAWRSRSALVPGALVIGVEPELAADARQSLREGRIVHWSRPTHRGRRRRDPEPR